MEAVAYAVAADLGDPLSPWDCVHPRRKREVGRRLALAARGIERGGRIRGPEFIPEAPALLKADVATGADKGSIRATFRLTRGADSPLASLVWAGTAGCNLTGTARCCGEAPFEFALDPPPPPRFDPPAVGAMLGVPDTSRATAKGTAMLGVLKGTTSLLKGDSVLRDATARDARIACARLGPNICAGFVALWNTVERGPMPDDVVLDAVHLVPRPEPGKRIAAEWNPDVSWTSVAFRGSDDPWVRATSFEVDAEGTAGFNGDESGWIATAELADETLVSAGRWYEARGTRGSDIRSACCTTGTPRVRSGAWRRLRFASTSRGTRRARRRTRGTREPEYASKASTSKASVRLDSQQRNRTGKVSGSSSST